MYSKPQHSYPVKKNYALSKRRIPDLNFKFPSKSYKDQLAKDRIKLRYCQRAWFDIIYISLYQLFKETGWYLLPCMFIIFLQTQNMVKRQNLLITQPHCNWKDKAVLPKVWQLIN